MVYTLEPMRRSTILCLRLRLGMWFYGTLIMSSSTSITTVYITQLYASWPDFSRSISSPSVLGRKPFGQQYMWDTVWLIVAGGLARSVGMQHTEASIKPTHLINAEWYL
jgi:hypothetical protein